MLWFLDIQALRSPAQGSAAIVAVAIPGVVIASEMITCVRPYRPAALVRLAASS